MIVKVGICIRKATSGCKIVTVTTLYYNHENFNSQHLKSFFQSRNDMKHEVFDDTPVPCMYACVHACSFAQKWAQWAKISEVFFLKKFFSFSLNNLKWNIVIYISLQSPYLSKVWLIIYVSKCFWPIRLQYFSKCNISRKMWPTK